MSDYGSANSGEAIADIYPSVDERTVPMLAGLACGGRVLEIGIGTGRVALPLLEAVMWIEGLDTSVAMVERLLAKPGGDRIPVTIGAAIEMPVEGQYTLVTALFNTFFMLGGQPEQVCCFGAVALHL